MELRHQTVSTIGAGLQVLCAGGYAILPYRRSRHGPDLEIGARGAIVVMPRTEVALPVL